MMNKKQKNMNFFYKQSYVLAIILCIVSAIFFGCAEPKPPVCKCDGQIYPKIDGLFLGKWWSYYEAALSYVDGECWDEAENAFMDAIKRKPEPEKFALKYGTHHINYYPYRELGIARYQQKKFDLAIQALEQSRKKLDSGRAVYYLNAARKGAVLSQDNDRQPPSIELFGPEDGKITADNAILVSGRVKDDTFVASIMINKTHVPLKLVCPQYQFKTGVGLIPGKNTISISVCDVAGNKTIVNRTVVLDQQGPVVFYNRPTLRSKPSQNRTISFKGMVLDDSGIDHVELILNNRSYLSQKGSDKTYLFIDTSLPLFIQNDQLILKATDRLGNTTQAKIQTSRLHQKVSSLLLATTSMTDLYFKKQTNDIQIKIDDYAKKKVVYTERPYLKINVFSNQTIESIRVFINNKFHDTLFDINAREEEKSIFFKLFELVHNPFLNICNSMYIPMEKLGLYEVTVSVSTNKTWDRRTFEFHRKMLFQEEAKMTVAIIPQNAEADTDIREVLLKELMALNRFNIIEVENRKQLDQVIKKSCMKLSTCYSLGISQAPLWILEWDYEYNRPKNKANKKNEENEENEKNEENEESKKPNLSVYTKLKNVYDNDLVIAAADEYKEDDCIADLQRHVCQMVLQKLVLKVPFIQCVVKSKRDMESESIDDNQSKNIVPLKKEKIVMISAGENRNVKKGRQCAFIRKIPVYNNTELVSQIVDILGEGVVKKVENDSSQVILQDHSRWNEIKEDQQVWVR